MLHHRREALELPGVRRRVLDGVPVHPAGPVAPLGVYVHFPYCTTRCPYCDFAVAIRKTIPHERYAAAVLAELDARQTRAASTLYFGGGTPGLWRASSLARVIDQVRARGLAADAEITVEVNPGETSLEHLRGLREAGVNRLSIGAQSFDDRSLKVLGRTHDASAARNAVAHARAAGFANVSLDLMFGLPQASREALDRELDALLSLETEHLSLYSLTIEPRTAFAALKKQGLLALPDDDRQAELYELVRARLASEGYVHHEISSWARPGFHARHNSIYWTQDEYVGVGSSASSLRHVGDAGERSTNVRGVDDYLRGRGERTIEVLDRDALEREALWLGMRLIAGLDRARHRARFGLDPLDGQRRTELQGLERAGLVEIGPQIVRLTSRGQLLADHVGATLL